MSRAVWGKLSLVGVSRGKVCGAVRLTQTYRQADSFWLATLSAWPTELKTNEYSDSIYCDCQPIIIRPQVKQWLGRQYTCCLQIASFVASNSTKRYCTSSVPVPSPLHFGNFYTLDRTDTSLPKVTPLFITCTKSDSASSHGSGESRRRNRWYNLRQADVVVASRHSHNTSGCGCGFDVSVVVHRWSTASDDVATRDLWCRVCRWRWSATTDVKSDDQMATHIHSTGPCDPIRSTFLQSQKCNCKSVFNSLLATFTCPKAISPSIRQHIAQPSWNTKKK